MNATLPIVLAACMAAVAVAQEKPPTDKAVVAITPLATSSQGEATAPVDIVLVLRHSPPAAGKCEKGPDACDAPEHWVVELQPAGGKAVQLTMDQRAELVKELSSAGKQKARKIGTRTVSDATVSLRVPLKAPHARVHAMLVAIAEAGLHKTEFAVRSAGKVEQRLVFPLPVDTEPKGAEAAPVEEVRITLLWDEARSDVTRYVGGRNLPSGAQGDALLRSILAESTEDLRPGKKTNAPGVIDAAGAVPWDAVVQIIDALRAAGVRDIRFAAGKGTK